MFFSVSPRAHTSTRKKAFSHSLPETGQKSNNIYLNNNRYQVQKTSAKKNRFLELVFDLKIKSISLISLEKISIFTILGACSYTGLWLFGKQELGNQMITSYRREVEQKNIQIVKITKTVHILVGSAWLCRFCVAAVQWHPVRFEGSSQQFPITGLNKLRTWCRPGAFGRAKPLRRTQFFCHAHFALYIRKIQQIYNFQ